MAETLSLAGTTGSQNAESVLAMALVPSVIATAQQNAVDQAATFQDKPRRAKTKYACPGCNNAVWGKPGMRISCGDCGKPFRETGLPAE